MVCAEIKTKSGIPSNARRSCRGRLPTSPAGEQAMDTVGFYTLVAILVLNLAVGWKLFTQLGIAARVQDAVWAHGLWTCTWLLWLLAWLVIWNSKGQSLLAATILEDGGAIFLVASALAYSGGPSTLKKYAPALFALFVLVDVVWPTVIVVPRNWKVPGEILINTVLFAPSLCLAVLAVGSLAWSFLTRLGSKVSEPAPGAPVPVATAVTSAPKSKHWEWGATMAFLAVGYALCQVVIYQANLFIPGGFLLPPEWKLFLLIWRVGFVLLYWLILLDSAAIEVPWSRVLARVSWLGPILASAVLDYVRKHWK